MPSSISSSSHPADRTPNANWAVVWGMTLCLAAFIVSGAELEHRSQGHRPSLVDSPEFWSFHRAQVSLDEPRQVVLLGASRMQLGFSTDVFRQRFPDHPLTQLAVDSRFPVATLVDLASEERFRGIVICSITEDTLRQERWGDQQEYVEHYRRRYAWPHGIDQAAGSFLQSRLVVLSPQVRPDRVLRCLLGGRSLPRPLYVVTRPDRSRQADYSLLDIQAHRQERIEKAMAVSNERAPTPAAWMKDVSLVEHSVRTITSRGGRVVLVRFPTSDESWEIDERRYPKSAYWDRMAEMTVAECIHFADFPSLAGFELPDTSHLDARDAPAFTSGLLDELVKRKILPVR